MGAGNTNPLELASAQVENSRQGYRSRAVSCQQPGIKALGTPGTPLASLLPPSASLLNSLPCLVLLFVSQGQNSG